MQLVRRSPSAAVFVCPDKTLADLEWPRLLDALAGRTVTPPGHAAALALPFLETEAEVRSVLAEVSEATEALLRGEALPVVAADSARTAVEHARPGGVLSLEEIALVRDLASAASRLGAHLASHRASLPLLAVACEVPGAARELASRLERVIDPDGSLSDSASPRLKELRAERGACRQRLVRKLEDLVGSTASALAGTYWTERDGRYVLPVRSDSLGKVPGIVHGASGSGATLFVEPQGAIDLGNRLKLAEAEALREEHAVLRRLSADVAKAADALLQAEDALVRADLRAASARLAVDLELSFPEIAAWPAAVTIELPRARHPLLVLQGTDVVPSRVVLRAGRALIVSGPNAGGKTVSLKTAGLAALLVRAGLPVPAASGARVALFDAVLTDVGDDQSVQQNLSTFSAHVKNVAGILERTGPRALVLLDELASGTDPREGEALATAVLEALSDRGGTAAVTTHYEGLKALAARDERMTSASVGFDLERMRPTFVLAIGTPGISAALAVAERFGVPHAVVERARGHLESGVVTFTEVVKRLEAERAAAAREREEIARVREELAELEETARQRDRELAEREKGKLQGEAQKLFAEVRKARADLRAAEEKLRSASVDGLSAPTPGGVDAARALVDAVSKQALPGGELEGDVREAIGAEPKGAADDVRVGSLVYVPKLRGDAQVIEVMPGDKVRVAAGSIKIVVPRAELRRPRAPAERPKKKPSTQRARTSGHTEADLDGAVQTADNTVDLRGLRAHEATQLAEQFMDRIYGAGDRVAFLIHGHGTGSLREAIRGLVQSSRYVRKHRPGEQFEGGDGVTVVLLRE